MRNSNGHDGPTHRPRHSRAEWAKEIERWRESGLSAAKYAAQHGLRAPSLFRWASEFREQPVPPSAKTLSFVPVHVRSDALSLLAKFDIEVTLRNGRKLRAQSDVDGSRLARLVQALDGGVE